MIRKRVREIMQEKDITAAKLASDSGLSRSMISKILSGQRGPKLSHSTVYAIASALGTTPEWLTEMDEDVHTLRDVVERCDNESLKMIFKQNLESAERLARGLFEMAGCVPLPYFTPHDASHCQAVERYLNQIIWRAGTPGPYDFVPTPEEAMYLLSAAWLHDIGMTYGIFQGEKPGDLAGDTPRVMRLRDEHEMRTVRYILDEWKLFAWDDYEKTLLAVICKYHSRRHPISTFEPAIPVSRYDGRPIRLVVLAALLRLADACHEEQSRAPGSLMALYASLGMPHEAAAHWERAKLVTAVHFDHTRRSITLKGQCPSKWNSDLAPFDLGEVVEIRRQDIEQELRSVQQVLLPYPNAYFGEVRVDISRSPGPELDGEKQYLALWPYLLHKPRSATEAAAALAQMLLFALSASEKTGDFGKAWRRNVFLPIMNETQESRPSDFMIRNLCQGLKDILWELPSDTESPESLKAYLQSSLEEIKHNRLRMAEFAEGLIGPYDALVVCGYSTNVAKFLENLRAPHANPMYIVDYHEPVGKVQLRPSENQRMTTFSNSVGFDQIIFLDLAALPQALNELKRRNTGCKVLLGTRGVLPNKDFLCKVGSYTVALVADTARKQGLDAEVIAFAETRKFLGGGESEAMVGAPEKLLLLKKMGKCPPMMSEATRLIPEIDLVPKQLVDLVVTEKGVFEPDAVSIPGDRPQDSLVSRKKRANPA